MEFNVQPQELKSISSNLQRVSGSIRHTADDMRTTALHMKGPDPNMARLAQSVYIIARSVDYQAIMVNKMSQVLQAAAQQYINTENKIVGSTSEIKGGQTDESSHALPKRDDIPKNIQDFLDSIDWSKGPLPIIISIIMQAMFPGVPTIILMAYLRKYLKERQESLEFQDQHQEYTRQVESMYDNASGRAKEAYDKFKNDVKIEEIPDPTDPKEEKSVSHYSKGSNTLYINMDDMNDQRGPASVYYHEYGHYIVDRMGWIRKDGTLSPEFKKFQDALRRDVQNYLDQIENRKRAEYQNMGYSGKQLERMVRDGTEQELEKILGGENRHVLDGVSDMIDAQTNSKYQITYRHPIDDNGRTYWEKDSSRQANEAFAEMFSSDFCSDDQAEIDFIKDHFPNAYSEYQNLLESVAK